MKEGPSELKACSRSEPDFSECLKASVEDALRKFGNGNKQLGVPPLEPLYIESISVGRIPTSSVSIDQKFSHVKLHGLSKSKINKVEVNPANFSLYVEAFTPLLRTEADFEIKGQLLIFPVNGKGPSNVTMTNLKSYHRMDSEMFTKKEKNYLRLTNYKITVKPEKIHYKFDDLLGGGPNARISQQIHTVINDNSLAIFEEVRAATEESYGIIFKEIANKIFTKVPLDEIYKI
ncbi:hypothetical protein ILUMI_21081 [Ignelater luminosus]|uniref:Protein takeout n=1 Tax=Ignelater luminosus TaxID=2038154 RepID=A0A8K0CIF3_IGNLU|nr:hypothetical protein ILUMI_21081 [Ignelater luminosus]